MNFVTRYFVVDTTLVLGYKYIHYDQVGSLLGAQAQIETLTQRSLNRARWNVGGTVSEIPNSSDSYLNADNIKSLDGCVAQ